MSEDAMGDLFMDVSAMMLEHPDDVVAMAELQDAQSIADAELAARLQNEDETARLIHDNDFDMELAAQTVLFESVAPQRQIREILMNPREEVIQTGQCTCCGDSDVQCFPIECSHMTCLSCMSRCLTVAVEQGGARIPVKCPGAVNCTQEINPDLARRLGLLPQHLQVKFDELFAKAKLAVIAAESVFTCFNPKCNIMYTVDVASFPSGEPIACPYCAEQFCAKCRMKWHDNLTCSQVQDTIARAGALNPDDIALTKLANSKAWATCSRCSAVVARIDGCNHMTCICGHAFCYGCGRDYPSLCQGSCVSYAYNASANSEDPEAAQAAATFRSRMKHWQGQEAMRNMAGRLAELRQMHSKVLHDNRISLDMPVTPVDVLQQQFHDEAVELMEEADDEDDDIIDDEEM